MFRPSSKDTSAYQAPLCEVQRYGCEGFLCQSGRAGEDFDASTTIDYEESF